MTLYHCRVTQGRARGAIGIFYPIVRDIWARDESDARAKFAEAIERIDPIVVQPVIRDTTKEPTL